MPTSPTPAAGPTTAAPARSQDRRADPQRIARVLRRAILPGILVAGLLFWFCYGAVRVPAGMDSMPGIPAGSLCLIAKRSTPKVGDEVFVELDDGSTLLSRLVLVGNDGSLVVQNDNPSSRLPDSDHFGALPADRLRGKVLVVFAAPGEPGEAVRGR